MIRGINSRDIFWDLYFLFTSNLLMVLEGLKLELGRSNKMIREKILLSVIIVCIIVNDLVAESRVITVYNQGFAIINEVRTLAGEKGRFYLRELPESIYPDSLRVECISSPAVKIIECSYEYKTFDPIRVLNKARGKKVELILKNGLKLEGLLLSAEGLSGQAGILAVKQDDIIRLFNQDNISHIALLEPAREDVFLLRPQLCIRSDGASDKEDFRITYKAGNISWKAVYNLIVKDDESLSLDAAIIIDNRSGYDFPHARLYLVAGRLYEAGGGGKNVVYGPIRAYAPVDKGALPQDAEYLPFSEYYLYKVPNETDLPTGRIRQLNFIRADNIPYKKKYLFVASTPRVYGKGYEEDFSPLIAEIIFRNSERAGLGVALPEGSVMCYKRTEDHSTAGFLIGQDRIGHTPADEDITIKLGYAFDVVGNRKVITHKRVSQYEQYEDIEIKIRNHREDPADIIVREFLNSRTNWTIEDSSLPYVKVDSRTIEFRFTLEGKSEKKINYRARYRAYSW